MKLQFFLKHSKKFNLFWPTDSRTLETMELPVNQFTDTHWLMVCMCLGVFTYTHIFGWVGMQSCLSLCLTCQSASEWDKLQKNKNKTVKNNYFSMSIIIYLLKAEKHKLFNRYNSSFQVTNLDVWLYLCFTISFHCAFHHHIVVASYQTSNTEIWQSKILLPTTRAKLFCIITSLWDECHHLLLLLAT